MFDFNRNCLYDKLPIKIGVAEDLIFEFINEINDQAVIMYPNRNAIFNIAMYLVHQDYDELYKKRKDYHRRVSILFITDVIYAVEYFKKIMISSLYIDESSIQQRNFQYEKGRFINLNDPYNAYIYWPDIFYSRYKSNLKNQIGFLPYKNYFPISLNAFGDRMIARDYLGKRDGQKPVYYLTSNENIFNESNLPYYDYIVIDYSRIRKYISNIPKNIPVIYFFDNLLDEKLFYVIKSAKKLAFFDPSLLNHITQQDNLNDEVKYDYGLNYIDPSILSIRIVEASFDEEMKELSERYRMSLNVPGKGYAKKLLSKFIMNVLSCPVTTREYDNILAKTPYAEPINDLIIEMKNCIEFLEDSNLVECRELARGILKKSDEKCFKTEKFFARINELLALKKKTIVMVPNQSAAIAFKIAFAEKNGKPIDFLEINNIVVCSSNELLYLNYSSENFDVAIATYVAGLKQLKALSRINADKYELYIYPLEASDIATKYTRLYKAICDADTTVFKSVLEKHGFQYEFSYLESMAKKFAKRSSTALEYRFPELEELLKTAMSNISRNYHEEYEGKNAVEANIVEFEDGTYMFFDSNDVLNVLSEINRDIEEKELSMVNSGDRVLFIEGKARRNLYELILEGIEKIPDIAACSRFIKFWHYRINEGYLLSQKTYRELYDDLLKHGFKKSYTEVMNWIKTRIMGPNKKEDVEMIGTVLNLKDIVELAEPIFKSLKVVRNIRRITARKLNEAIFSVNSGRTLRNTENLEEYGISFEELKRAIEIKTVVGISQNTYKVKPSELGNCYISEKETRR